MKREMKKCEETKYDFSGFNCCHCAEQAMKALRHLDTEEEVARTGL
ncbi:MAG: hypothetical protein HC872_00675 [Gammaproteobacteria bacterium]|nr:hypothetical protein [Gammaproteobacteria bacterium]